MTTQALNVSVSLPVSLAIDRVKRLLFQPFDLGKWFIIGFCAWLAQMGEGGFGGVFNFGSPGGRGGGPNLGNMFEQARNYVMSNLSWIVPLGVALAFIGFAFWVIFTWLSSRGRFMFLHCVALNRAEVGVPWRKFAREGNSLFWFRLVLGLIGMVPSLPLLVVAVIMVIRMINRGGPSIGGLLGLIGIVLLLVGVGMVFALIGKLTTDFVAPMMFLRGGTCRQRWAELLGLLSRNVGHFILYVLFQIGLGMGIGMIVVIIVIATCCIAGCVLAIPYLGTVLLLPVLVFQRAYSLCYLAQYGPDYDVFAAPAASTPGLSPPQMSA